MVKLTVAEVNGMRAAEMKRLLLDLASASDNDDKTSDPVSTMLDTVKLELTNILEEVRLGKEERDNLKDEIQTLKKEIEDHRQEAKLNQESLLKEIRDLKEHVSKPCTTAPTQSEATYADVVRSSVRSVIHDEQCKAEMIFSSVEEKGKDREFIANLCDKMDLQTKPIEISRLGRSKPPSTDRPRLLKVTFQTAFDARTFRVKYDEVKGKEGIPSHRLRNGRNKDQQALFKKNSAIAHKLNEDARKSGSNASFTLRDNGEVWKFSKQEGGMWIREEQWKLSTSTRPGN